MQPKRQRIAVIGAGIAGNSAAWALAQDHDVTLIEAEGRLGGHAHTIEIDQAGAPAWVDTGFIVYNELNYPSLISLFDKLGVQTVPSNMSFGISLDGGRFEYKSDASFGALFARRRNLVSPRFWRLLADIPRFYNNAEQRLDDPRMETMSLMDLLADFGVSEGFIEDHILPMAGCIWSASQAEIRAFPAASFLRFFKNHGLFRLKDRPQWRTVEGGSRQYLEKLTAATPARVWRGAPVQSVQRGPHGVTVHAQGQAPETFDHAVLACHADQALKMIANPTQAETAALSAFGYSDNRVIVHRDAAAMPRRRAAWASWNYVAESSLADHARVPVTYWMNSLQPFIGAPDLFVSLNPVRDVAANQIVRELNYSHPVFNAAAMAAQKQLPALQGAGGLWLCGSYHGYGFHEDACASGLEAARLLRQSLTYPMAAE